MEKTNFLVSQIRGGFYFLLFVWFGVSSLASETVKVPIYGKGNYLSIDDVLVFFPEIRKHFDPIFDLVSLESPTGKLKFRIGSGFYTFDGKIEKISKKILEKDSTLYLPLELTEAILINLISYDVRYKFKSNELLLDIAKDVTPKKDINVKAIIIDPGHGGKDPGTSDAEGYFEKNVSLQVGRYLYLYLRKYYPEIRIIMTRKTDHFIELEERSRIANRILKDTRDSIFVSLHCNASLNEKANGFEIYYLSQSPSTEQAREVAILENKFVSAPKRQIAQIQSELLSSVTQRRSKRLASKIEESYGKNLSEAFPSRGVKKADFSVLRGSLMPAVLVEMGYLTNSGESKSLKDKEIQKQIARSIIKGIRSYSDAKD